MGDDAGMPHAPDVDLDALMAVLAARLQDAGTVLLAGAPVPAPLKRTFPSLPSILGQGRDNIAPCDRLPAPSAHQIEAAHDILTLAVALIGNPSHIRVVVLGVLRHPRTRLRFHPDTATAQGFGISVGRLALIRRNALRAIAAGMCREAETADRAA